ncbi:MAG: ATP-binding protein [Planctomycetes bacterium]|nr:ATP-binding protein [Planctomycetota bacterium]
MKVSLPIGLRKLIIVLVAVLPALLVAPFALLMTGDLHSRVEERARLVYQSMAEALANHISAMEGEEAAGATRIDGLARFPILAVLVYDENEKLLENDVAKEWNELSEHNGVDLPTPSSAKSAHELLEAAPHDFLHEAGHYFVASANMRTDSARTLLLVVSSRDFNVEVIEAQNFAWQVTIGCLFFGALLAFFLDKAMSLQIRKLIETAEAMASGDLARRIEIRTGDDIERLGKSFNQMAVSLQKREKELTDARRRIERHAEDLEKVVEARTRDLREAQAQLIHSERIASIGLMAAGIAHEIGNPLAAMSALLTSVQAQTADEEHAQRLRTVKQHIDRIASIVRDLVLFSRPKGKEARLEDVNAIIESAVGISRYQGASPDIIIESRLDKKIPRVKTVGDHLMQILINLLMNARDALENSGGRIKVISHKEKSEIVIEVSDNGPGIAAEEMDMIFDPFYSSKPPGKGTGLGLSVSRQLIGNLGGRIEVQSEPGVRTTFRIRHPITEHYESSANMRLAKELK